MMSRMIRSGLTTRIKASASSPVVADRTSKPSAAKYQPADLDKIGIVVHDQDPRQQRRPAEAKHCYPESS